MSEFSAEHSDQRLIGAPPGYIGYDVGGELTNAVRERPFSVVLFDEIEKAHPRILDKFLQVLDDGVLTSGRGDRVYFSETLIVFTSNLGIYRQERDGSRVANVTLTDDFATIEHKVLEEIDSYFKTTLNRPELLNRIGDNILVFDYIRRDIAEQIFEQMVASTRKDILAGQGIEIEVEAAALRRLAEHCLSDLSNGGRGIRNKLETHFINPIARSVFDMGILAGGRIEIEDLRDDGAGLTLHIRGNPVTAR
jgi:ATP-dependent Clp protease ATP-binding subunit ClpA